jgi:hypothetical protein
MVVAEEFEPSMDQIEPYEEDKEKIKNLVLSILQKVEESFERKTSEYEDSHGPIPEIQNSDDPNVIPIGSNIKQELAKLRLSIDPEAELPPDGNIKLHDLEGLSVIEDLVSKLKSMNDPLIDPSNVDYGFLENFLGSMIERGGEREEEWKADLSELQKIEPGSIQRN